MCAYEKKNQQHLPVNGLPDENMQVDVSNRKISNKKIHLTYYSVSLSLSPFNRDTNFSEELKMSTFQNVFFENKNQLSMKRWHFSHVHNLFNRQLNSVFTLVRILITCIRIWMRLNEDRQYVSHYHLNYKIVGSTSLSVRASTVHAYTHTGWRYKWFSTAMQSPFKREIKRMKSKRNELWALTRMCLSTSILFRYKRLIIRNNLLRCIHKLMFLFHPAHFLCTRNLRHTIDNTRASNTTFSMVGLEMFMIQSPFRADWVEWNAWKWTTMIWLCGIHILGISKCWCWLRQIIDH